jgi:hypothetical protein
MSKPITMLDLCKAHPEKAAERIDSLIKRNAVLEKASCWTCVDEEWPNPENGNVLGHNGDYAFECSWDDGFWCNIGGEDFTHWKPLRPPAKALKDPS